MELDELKRAWTNVERKSIDTPLIGAALQLKYKSKINKIIIPEIIGMVICLLAAVYLGFQLKTLETLSLQAIGVIAMLLLVIIPILSFISFFNLNTIGNVQKPHAEVIRDFALQKLRFYKVQKINTMLCYLLLVAVIVLLANLYGKNITDSKMFWIFSFSGGYILLQIYSGWVQKYYKRTILQMEELLEELK